MISSKIILMISFLICNDLQCKLNKQSFRAIYLKIYIYIIYMSKKRIIGGKNKWQRKEKN